MIIPTIPKLRRMILEVYRPLSILFVWDVIVTVFYYVLPFHAPALPLTLFGTAIALLLGFRDNSAYQRWWEGRQLWGAMINASRSLSRAVTAFPDDAADGVTAFKRRLVRRQIAYVNALRCQLRRQDPVPAALPFLEGTPDVLSRQNPANGLLDETSRELATAQRLGWVDTIQQTQIERVLVDIANAQGGMERLKNTPLPAQYRFFPNLFARLFCLLLPVGLVEDLGFATPVGSTLAGLMFLAILQIADDLVDPFADSVHDVPMTAMCRTIEIDLCESIGDRAPPKMSPVDGILW